MYQAIVKVSKKRQIAIPKIIRNKLGADIFHIEMIEDKVILKPAESILKIGGSLRNYSKDAAVQELSNDEDYKAWEKHVKEKFRNSGY